MCALVSMLIHTHAHKHCCSGCVRFTFRKTRYNMGYVLFVCIYAYRYRLLRRENDDPSSPYLYVIVAAASYFIKTEMVGVNVNAVDNVVKGLCIRKANKKKL